MTAALKCAAVYADHVRVKSFARSATPLLLLLLASPCVSQISTAIVTAAGSDAKPRAESFTTYEDYVDALTTWRIMRTVRVAVTGPKLAAMELATLRDQVAGLYRETASLTDQLADARKSSLSQSIAILGLQRESVSLDPFEPNGYGRINTAAGDLLVSLGKVEPYLDGYKLQLNIGNPLSITLKEFNVTVKWAPRLKKDTIYAEWVKGERSKTVSFAGDLLPSRWNPCEIILPETKPEGFGYLELSISVNTVFMKQ